MGARGVTRAARRVTGCSEGGILTNAGGLEGEVGGGTVFHTLRGLREEDEWRLTGETVSGSGASAGRAGVVTVMTEGLERKGGGRTCLIAHVSGVGKELTILARETAIWIRAVTGSTRRMAL